MRFLILLILLSSCSASWHLKRAKLKGAELKSDTVFVMKEVVVPEVTTDTVFTSLPGNTILITKEKLKIKYVKLAGDSVYIEGKCDADTIRIEVPVTVTNEIKAGKSGLDLWVWLLAALAAGFIVGYIVKVTR